MKKLVFIFLIYAIQFGQYSFAQSKISLQSDSVKLFASYILFSGYINDSTYSKAMDVSLFMGKNSSVSQIQYQNKEEYLNSLGKGLPEQYRQSVIEQNKQDPNLSLYIEMTQLHYYNTPEYYELKLLNEKGYWVADTFDINWQPLNEFKKILGYKCQKAEGSYKNNGNEKVYAWFTEEIPLPAGPSTLYGLPGLILEYNNPLRKVFYKVTKITSEDIPKPDYLKFMGATVISKKDYIKENNKLLENIKKLSGKTNVDN